MTTTPQLPVRHFAFILSGTEYERGWGCRPDGYVAFLDEEKASAWNEAYNKRHNSETEVPYEYTKYSAAGFKEVSEKTMLTILEKGLCHAHHLKDL